MSGFVGTADAVEPRHNWTGFYVGLNAGAAFNDSRYDLKPGTGFDGWTAAEKSVISGSGDFDNTSFTGGLQAGYNYQINNFVIGLETDFNYNGIDEADHVNRVLPAPDFDGNMIHTVKQKVDYFGTLRLRLGYTPANLWLVYLTGGLAYGHVRSSSDIMFTATDDIYRGSKSATRTGWTIGGGAEYAIAKQWSLKAEYLYVDLGSMSYSSPYCGVSPCDPTGTYKTDLTTREHIVRFGINYKF